MKKNNEYNEFDEDKTTQMESQEVENETETAKQSVNPKEKALALIEKELAKKDVPHTENEVEDVLDVLYAAYEADGTVPTREAFAEQCPNDEVGETVLAMKRDPFIKGKLGKGGIAAICAGCILAIALIGGGVWYTVASQPHDVHSTGSTVASATEKKAIEKQDKTDSAESEKADETQTDGETNTDESQTDGQASEATAQDDTGTAGGNGSASASKSGSGSGSSSKPSGGSTGSTGGSSSSSSSTQAQKPSHTHNWVPITTTKHHDAVYKTVHHDAVTEARSICNGCGADITGNVDAHMKEALLAGNTACGAYHTEYVTTKAAYDEQVLVSNAWDETVTTGYKCSTCGATK